MGSRQLSVHSTQFFCSYGQQAVGRYAVFLLQFLQFFCCYGQQAVER